MNKYFFLLLSAMLFIQNMEAQITITDTDLMSAGDTFRVSIANPQQYQLSVLTPTGANQTWDFSNLIAVSQTIDTFIDVLSANPLYLLTFSNLSFNPNRANIVQQFTGTVQSPLPVTLDNPATFYYKNSSNFRSPGTGLELSGIATAIPYGSEKDTIYKFPLNYNDTDSGSVSSNIAIPGLGGYYSFQNRLWLADGWGTLITPYGTHDVLRVKIKLSGKDSLVDTNGFGFALPRPERNVYRWLAKNEGIPLLEITTSKTFNTTIISGIRYRDNFTPVLSSIAEQDAVQDLQVFPNPCNGESIALRFSVTKPTSITVTVYDAQGRICDTQQHECNDLTEQLVVNKFNSRLQPGHYQLQVSNGNKLQTQNFLVK